MSDGLIHVFIFRFVALILFLVLMSIVNGLFLVYDLEQGLLRGIWL